MPRNQPMVQKHVASAANAPAAVTFTAKPGVRFILANLNLCYDGVPPAAGGFTISGVDLDGVAGTVEHSLVANGLHASNGIDLIGLENTNMVITILAGGVGIAGRITAQVREEGA